MDKKIKYIRLDYDLHASLLEIKERSGICLERLTAEAIKLFIKNNQHLQETK